MKMLRNPGATELVAIAAGATALALPPGAYGLVPASWSGSAGVVPEFELEIWAPAALALTAAILYGATLHPLVYADQTVTGAAATNLLTKATHGLLTGDGPFQFSNVGGALPGGLLAATDYWVIKIAADTFKVATSLADALTGTFVDLTVDGTGTTTISDTASTQRVYWQTHDGLLGKAGDGAVSLTAQVGYRKRIPHSPRVIAYALVGTIDTGSLSAAIVANVKVVVIAPSVVAVSAAVSAAVVKPARSVPKARPRSMPPATYWAIYSAPSSRRGCEGLRPTAPRSSATERPATRCASASPANRRSCTPPTGQRPTSSTCRSRSAPTPTSQLG